MKRTVYERALSEGAVFLTLQQPYKGITSSTVAKILASAIDLAGLKDKGYGPKSFRPTGATAAVATGHDPEKVRKLGRWKTDSVFLEHYVHVIPNMNFTSDVLNFSGNST